MEYSEDPDQLKEWIPLIMEGRTSNEPLAATKIDSGTDINFGALTRMLFDHLKSKDVEMNYKHSVKDIKRTQDGSWKVKVHDIEHGKTEYHTAKFIFIGGGAEVCIYCKNRYPRVQTYWRISGKRIIHGMQEPGSGSAASCQSIRKSQGWRSADVGSPLGHKIY